MGEIIAQLIELVNIGVAVFAIFAGVCLVMLAAAVGLHLLGSRTAEPARTTRRTQRGKTSRQRVAS